VREEQWPYLVAIIIGFNITTISTMPMNCLKERDARIAVLERESQREGRAQC